MDLIQALVLGIVQGLTEFLPISSSAHLIIVPWLLGWTDPGTRFDVALHLGTLVAVLAYFRKDWLRLLKALFSSIAERKVGTDTERRLVWYILFASVPAAIAGLLGDKKITEFFHNPSNLRTGLLVIGVMLILLGLLLFLAERAGRHNSDLREIRLDTAMGIGLAQAVALIPGVSRSGSTITAGLFFGLKREDAARFSFLLLTPIVLGAGLKSVYDLLKDKTEAAGTMSATAYAVGFVTAAVVGFLCIHFLLRYLQHRSTAPFIVYRLLAGTALIVLVLLGFHV